MTWLKCPLAWVACLEVDFSLHDERHDSFLLVYTKIDFEQIQHLFTIYAC